MNENRLAVCEFCGQTFYSEAESEQERKREALMKCNCASAVIQRKKISYIDSAKRQLREVFEYNFFSAEESRESDAQEDIREILCQVLPYMVDFDVTSLTVSIPTVGKVSLNVNADGEIKIKRQIGKSIEKKVSK